MTRIYSISQITPSGGIGSPGKIKLTAEAGDVVSSFTGRFFRSKAGLTQPGYVTEPGQSFSAIQATTFDVIDNPSYNGRYTVYSPRSLADAATHPSSIFENGCTEITVNEMIGGAEGGALTSGSITGISTYSIPIVGEENLIIPPTVALTGRPLELIGRSGVNWGEAFTENFMKLAQNFAGAEPQAPYLGQSWFDTSVSNLKLRTNDSTWSSVAMSHRVPVTKASKKWVITHDLNLPEPYVCGFQVFVEAGGAYQAIIPLSVSFVNQTQVEITFSAAKTGIVILFT